MHEHEDEQHEMSKARQGYASTETVSSEESGSAGKSSTGGGRWRAISGSAISHNDIWFF